MTTGFKINHASDNAAGYSIAQNMVSKLASYDIASSNISSGIDLVKTAQDTISLMQSHGERIQALITQAQNGTYAESSLAAINSEVEARIAEINRLYATTEYNGINILKGTTEDSSSEGDFVNFNEFIRDPIAKDNQGNPIDVDSLTSVDGLSDFSSASQFKISTKEELEHFRDLVNGGAYTGGKTFYLADDIDLGKVSSGDTNWTPIGNTSSRAFRGNFNGNGHKITNLNINETSQNNQGLFGFLNMGTIKNLQVEGNVKAASDSGILVGHADGGAQISTMVLISNCSVTGSIQGTYYTGGLVGSMTSGAITDSSSNVTITNTGYAGGIVGYHNAYAQREGYIDNCYSVANVTGTRVIGGICGSESGTIKNSYSSGTVSATENVGGLIGVPGRIQNSYSTSTVMLNNVDVTNSSENTTLNYQVDTIPSSLINNLAGYNVEISDEDSDNNGIITIQVGINGNASSSITFDCGFKYDLSEIVKKGAQKSSSYNVINKFLKTLSNKSTQLGAIENRLESALDSTMISMENLTSSLSTIRDADIAKESSAYIKSQILQQAGATLLATANQSPAIALQLL